MQMLAAIPSPTQSVWHLGPLPVRAYAMCIIVGIFVALAITRRRWRERGGNDDDLWDIAFYVIIFGIIGGRLYHVITDYQKYFTDGGDPINALKVWDGGLGIWGAVALGFLGGWFGCRRKNVRVTAFADAAAPGVILAQAIGRWGNWFNNELYGRATNLPWKLQIHDLDIETGKAAVDSTGSPIVLGYFHPTFLYECLWNIAIFGLLIFIDRRYRLGQGNVFALYVMGYTAGRFWIEMMRIDEAHHFFGIRLNVFTALVVFCAAAVWFARHGGLSAPRELTVNTRRHRRRAKSGEPAADEAASRTDDAASEDGADAET